MFNEIRKEILYKRLLNGKWIKANDFIDIYSPVDNKLIGKVPSMTKSQVDEAISIAKKAQKTWAAVPLHERCNILEKGAENLYQVKEDIANMMANEISKDYKSALSEITRTVEMIKETIQDAKRITGEVLSGDYINKSSENKMAIVKRVPVGVVLAISPFNYPVNLAASKIAPALIMGNSVVFKPATCGSITATMFIRALELAGIPSGVLNTITGKGSVIGDHIIQNKNINMINFTGSTETGEKIAKQAGMIPLVMELGGKDSAIILEDANLEKAATEIINGAYSYSGQRCTAIKRVLAMENIFDKLCSIIKEKLTSISVGNPFDNCTVTPLIDNSSADFVESLVIDAQNKGATIFSTGKRKENTIYPTLIENVTKDMKVYEVEPFGPILPMIKINSIDEAIEINNSSIYGLQSSIFSNDINKIFYIAEKLESGTVNVNGKSERGPDNFPFLGIKSSGIGIQGIRYSLESCTNIKSIVINKQN